MRGLRWLMSFVLLAFAVFALSGPAFAKSPLAPLKTDHPRDTMRSFYEKMDEYRAAALKRDEQAEILLDDASRCFDVSRISAIDQERAAKHAAVMLKETLDRVIALDYERIPEATEGGVPVTRWRLKDTEVVIHRVTEGERAGEYLFSPDTTARATHFYQKVKDLPYLAEAGRGAGYRGPWLERNLPSWTRQTFMSLTWWQWGALSLAVFIGLLMRVIVTWLASVTRRLSSRAGSPLGEALVGSLSAPVGYLAATGIWYASLRLLQFQGTADSVLSFSIKVLFYAALTYLAYRFSSVVADFSRRQIVTSISDVNEQLVELLQQTIKVVAVVFSVLLAAQNLGIDVFSLIAGLGIGGLAVALAAKDTLANFFGSIMIMVDQPFRVGHWIVVKGAEGTVESVGFRSTKIRTFYDSVISIPNSEVVMANVDNYGLRQYRRTVTTLSLTYDTPPEQLEAFLEGIKNVLRANPYARQDVFHVAFKEFGASGLDVLLYFFFRCPDWSTELIARQNVYLEILRLAKDLGVNFAFPTQTLHVESMPGAKPAREAPEVDRARYATIAKNYGVNGAHARPEGLGLFTPPSKEVPPTETRGSAGE